MDDVLTSQIVAHLDEATTVLRFLAAVVTFLVAGVTAVWRVRRWARHRRARRSSSAR